MSVCPKCHAILPTHNPWCPDVQPPPVYSNTANGADVTREPTGGQGLREAVARAMPGWVGLTHDEPWYLADAILALPELAAVIADADNWRRATTGDPTQPLPLAMQARDLLVRNRELEADAERVRRVRELTQRYDDDVAPDGQRLLHGGGFVCYAIRRALDGEPQP